MKQTARLACIEDDPPGIRGKRQLQTGAWQALGEQRPWGGGSRAQVPTVPGSSCFSFALPAAEVLWVVVTTQEPHHGQGKLGNTADSLPVPISLGLDV